jgi:O-antigen ligase
MLIMGSLAVMTLALFFTFSRSAWLAIILSFAGVMLWLRRRGNASQRQIFYSLLVIMAVIVAIFGTTLSGALEARLVGEQRLEVESIRLRVTFAQQAMTVIQNTRGLGTGIGNYTLGVYGFVNDNWPFWYYQPVHNIYFLVLAEVGILGLGLFLAAILSLLRAALRQLKSLETLFLSLGLCSLLIIGMVDHYTWTLYFGILTFWLVIGLMLRQISPPNAELKD